MSGTYTVTMGARGRLGVPAELRRRAGIAEGDTLTLIESGSGVVILTRLQLQRLVREDLVGPDLVAELIADRRGQDAADTADADRTR